MELSEVFESVALHLVEQGQRCEVRGTIMLRHGTLADPIGALLGPSRYDPGLEGLEVQDDELVLALASVGVDAQATDVAELLLDLIDVHDMRDPTEWPKCLRGLLLSHPALVPTDRLLAALGDDSAQSKK